jgi:hypothetical protein
MAGNPLTNPNWAPELADTIDKYVGAVRDKATRKAVVVVRGLVFGLLIAVTAVVALVVGIILGVKLLQRIVNIGGWIDGDGCAPGDRRDVVHGQAFTQDRLTTNPVLEKATRCT